MFTHHPETDRRLPSNGLRYSGSVFVRDPNANWSAASGAMEIDALLPAVLDRAFKGEL